MSPRLLRKIAAIIRDGATVFGPPPARSPSLERYPHCDTEVRKLAQEIWGECNGTNVFSRSFGKGRVLWRKTAVRPMEQYGDYSAITGILKQTNVRPDFESAGPVRFTHRRDKGADIYFVANRTAKALETTCTFRVAGKQPELFDPLTGESRALPQYSSRDGCTDVPLNFEAQQSYFVVFRASPSNLHGGPENFTRLKTELSLNGPWEVSFDPKWGGPEKIIFNSLDDWSRRPEPGIKYYSGKAVYRKSFVLTAKSAKANRKYFLDLGQVKNLARIQLNGQDLGVVWCAPWRMDITGAITSGTNQLEVEVANLWPNRLIGDLMAPAGQQLTWTTRNPFKKESSLLPSGLLGPVSILKEEAKDGLAGLDCSRWRMIAGPTVEPGGRIEGHFGMSKSNQQN
jgi:hypothetical protein